MIRTISFSMSLVSRSSIRTGLTVLLTSTLIPICSAQYVSDVSKVGTVAATFLEIEVGARAIGMGGAYTSVANDVSAIYWNPAGLARMTTGEAGFVHTSWLADVNFDHVSAVFPLSGGMVVGGFLSAITMPEMEVRTIELPEGTGEMFSASDLALGGTFAMRLTDRLTVGANAKYIRQAIWHMSASAVAMDMGLLFRTPFKDAMFGMSVSNFGTDMQMTGRDVEVYHDIDPQSPGNNDQIKARLITDTWSLPLMLRVGLSKEVYRGTNGALLISVDAVHPNDNYEYVNAGGELNFRDWFFLRGGYKALFLKDSEQGLTLGAGMRFRLNGNMAFVTDIAYADFGRLENVYRYSLGVRF